MENKIVFIMVKVKPKYLKEFAIMMIACKELRQRKESKVGELAEILNFFPIFGTFDFYINIRGDDKKIFRTILIIREKFSIYTDETCTLPSFDVSKLILNVGKELLKILDENKYELNDLDNADKIDPKELLESYFGIDCTALENCVQENNDFIISKYNTSVKINTYKNKAIFEVNKGKIYNLLFKKNEYLFCWDKIPGDDDEILIKILNSHFPNKLVKKPKFEKIDDGRAIEMSNGKNFLLLSLNDEKTKVNLKIDDRIIYEFIVKNENSKLNIYKDGNLGDCPKHFREYLGEETFQRLLYFKQELDNSTNNVKDGDEDQRFVFVRVKPVFTEKFFLAITLIKKFCKDSTSNEFAEIKNIHYIVGQFDYLLEINGNNENKIGKTIFRIRETLGDYIFDTVTIKKIYLPITNDEIEKLFKNILGEKYILNKSGEKIPNENNKSRNKFNLEEIYKAETSSLRNLLNAPKFLLESECLNKRIDEMENRIEKLEKIIRNNE